MNHIEQAYQQGVLIRCKGWSANEWIKKHSDIESIAEDGKIYLNTCIDFDFNKRPNDWEIFNAQNIDIKAQIQTHLNQIQELLKQL